MAKPALPTPPWLPYRAASLPAEPITAACAPRLRVLTRLGRPLVEQLAFTPDGSRLVIGSKWCTWVYETATGRALGSFASGHFALAPDADHIAFSSGIVRLSDGACAVSFSEVVETPLAFSRDGARLLCRVSQNKCVVRSVREPGKDIALSPCSGPAIFSADGRWIIGRAKGAVALWDLANKATVRKVALPKRFSRSNIGGLALSGDGETLAVRSDEGFVFFATRNWTVRCQNEEGMVSEAELRECGMRVVRARDHTLVFDGTGQCLTGFECLSANGDYLADDVSVRSTRDDSLLWEDKSHIGALTPLAFAGETLYGLGPFTQCLVNANVVSGACQRLAAGSARALALSADATTLAVDDAAEPGAVRLLGAGDGRERMLLMTNTHDWTFERLRFAPRGHLLFAVDQQQVLHVFDAKEGKLLYGKPNVTLAVFTRDGRAIVAASAGELTLLEAASGNVLAHLAPSGKIAQIALARDGVRLAIVRRMPEPSICILALPGLQTLATIQPDGVMSILFLDDGDALVGARSGTLQRFRTSDGHREWSVSIAEGWPELSTLADGRTLVLSSTKFVSLIDAAGATLVNVPLEGKHIETRAAPQRAALSADGMRIVVATSDTLAVLGVSE